MIFINTTPHPIKIRTPELDLPPATTEYLIRVQFESTNQNKEGIVMLKPTVTNIPPKLEGVRYITSRKAAEVIKLAHPERDDFVFPDGIIYERSVNKKGQQIAKVQGAKRLATFS